MFHAIDLLSSHRNNFTNLHTNSYNIDIKVTLILKTFCLLKCYSIVNVSSVSAFISSRIED